MKQPTKNKPFIFGKTNYLIMIGGIVLMAIGYLLMQGGGSDDPNVFNEDIFSPRRIRVAPTFIILGFIAQVFAIMYQPKSTDQ
ncbi:DUF3098 domain-containing protein [Schleiferia thermophila]|jgi:hypothetical protein|uniref:DUF3098 family protein n=1 Tax=Schleiferia thermophila TaxID=884107 RepID=A0A369A5C2_9FLAO|nr:DUF3098 domain-containing protein [Schleiferia thermophila]KFD39341.1 hypothetical protein AT05_05790 [Schleiferia thermophila str. Yellowstone]RCX03267.1 DUF3098 family protein [Schleiferia thermophila]GCD80395.1 hypothetical protein JCM30197_16420 [Schleiferia thermophila]